MEALSDAAASIYSYITANPSEKHKLVGLGLRMQEEAEEDYIQLNAGGTTIQTYARIFKEYLTHYNRAFFNTLARNFRSNQYYIQDNYGYVALYYKYEDVHGHRHQSYIGDIYITSTWKPSTTTRAANQDDSHFFIVKFVPKPDIRGATDITIPEYRQIHNTIKTAIRRVTHTEEGDIERVKKQITALEEARPNFPQDLRGILGDFLVQPSRAEESSFFRGEHLGARKRVGNIGNMLSNRLTKKRGGATKRRSNRTKKRNTKK